MRRTSFVVVSIVATVSLAACKGKETPSTTTASAGSVAATAATAAATTAAAAATTAAAAAAAVSPAKLGLKTGEEMAASCDTISADSECGEVLVTDAAKKADAAKAMQSLCKKGTVGTACPTTDIVGSCRIGKDMLNHYYGKGPKAYDAAKAKAACEKGHGHPVEG